MDLSIHTHGRQSRSRKTGRSFESQLRTRTERHLHAGREMDCVSLESARSDSRLCSRGEANEVKSFRTGSGCSLSRRTGEGQGEGRFVRDSAVVRHLFLLKRLAGTIQWFWGARPPRALWAAPSRPTRHTQTRSLISAFVRAGVRREGAPNSSRGGCAPHSFGLHRSGLAGDPARTGRHLLLFVCLLLSVSARTFAASTPIRFAGQNAELVLSEVSERTVRVELFALDEQGRS